MYSYYSGLLDWQWKNYTVAPVPVKYPGRRWVKFISIKLQYAANCMHYFRDLLYIPQKGFKCIKILLWKNTTQFLSTSMKVSTRIFCDVEINLILYGPCFFSKKCLISLTFKVLKILKKGQHEKQEKTEGWFNIKWHLTSVWIPVVKTTWSTVWYPQRYFLYW